MKHDAGDLDVTAGWGHGGKGGVTMPGRGMIIERDYSKEELLAIHEGGPETLQQLGERTCDIYLNDTACWKNVPLKVWKYTIGGYQVMKKWLSYRERVLLGRGLTTDEAREVTNMTRRIAAILLLEPDIDENYRAAKESTFKWSTGDTRS